VHVGSSRLVEHAESFSRREVDGESRLKALSTRRVQFIRSMRDKLISNS
jgi:hypothetical protein